MFVKKNRADFLPFPGKIGSALVFAAYFFSNAGFQAMPGVGMRGFLYTA